MPRCKNCKDKFEPKYFDQKFCMIKDECIKAFSDKVQEDKEKAQRKEWAKEKEEKSPDLYLKKYKGKLDAALQKLARLIDNKFGYNICIDCGSLFGKQQDGGHFNSKGDNGTLRWNLHNIHSQKSNCNKNGLGGGRRLEYYRGLVSRYGQKYADYVDTGLQKEYKYIGLTNQEVGEKLKLVNKILRNFETFEFTGPLAARTQLNIIIGIYPTNPCELDLSDDNEDNILNQLF